jgi:hypothetical protein
MFHYDVEHIFFFCSFDFSSSYCGFIFFFSECLLVLYFLQLHSILSNTYDPGTWNSLMAANATSWKAFSQDLHFLVKIVPYLTSIMAVFMQYTA